MNENNQFNNEFPGPAKSEGVEIDLMEIFHLLKGKILFILAAAIIFASAAGIYTSFFVEPKYKASARIYVDGDYSQAEATVAISLATNIAKDYPYIIESRNVLGKVSENLNLGVPASALVNVVKVSIPSEEAIRVLDISVTYDDPNKAAAITNELVEVLKVELPTFAEYARISIRVIDTAEVPKAPSSPNVMRNVVVAGLAGAIIAALVFIVINMLDDKVKSEGDIEKYLGLNMLAAVPDYNEISNQRKVDIRNVLKKKTNGQKKSSNKSGSQAKKPSSNKGTKENKGA